MFEAKSDQIVEKFLSNFVLKKFLSNFFLISTFREGYNREDLVLI